jgi:hypothetical protein
MVAVKDHRLAARQLEPAARIANQPQLQGIHAASRADGIIRSMLLLEAGWTTPPRSDFQPLATLAKYICLG